MAIWNRIQLSAEVIEKHKVSPATKKQLKYAGYLYWKVYRERVRFEEGKYTMYDIGRVIEELQDIFDGMDTGKVIHIDFSED